MKTKKLLTVLAFCFIVAFSCSNDHTSDLNPAISKIHIAMSSEIGSTRIPQHWLNGTISNLSTNSNNVILTGIVGNATDIYISGYELQGTVFKAAYWKNGEKVELPGAIAITDDIAIENSDVYVCGYIPDNNKAIATYWKNGQPVSLSDGSYDTFATGITVYGNDIYVCGYEIHGSINIAKTWKNGVVTNLTNGTQNSEAHDIAISGNDVYVTGFEHVNTHDVAKIWKNGTGTNLSNGSSNALGYCLFVNGNDIYVGGRDNNKPVYWLNNTPHELETTIGYTTEYIYGIYATNTDVYACGYTDDGSKIKAKYWKNSTSEIIGLDNNTSSFAFGIYVN